jgi:hypothetical protein
MAPRDPGPRGTVVDENTFTLVTELEVRKAVRLQYYVSLLAIQPDPEGDAQHPNPDKLARQLAQVISRQVRGTDLICFTSAFPHLHLLLVSTDLPNLPVVIQRITQEVSRHVFQVNGQRKPVALSMGGACFPTTAGTREDLVSQVASLVTEARQGPLGRYRYRLAETRPVSPPADATGGPPG